ncbi:hypothetical protein [Bacillus sp. FJAT-44742]|uniref:hypothetical protein n=1 Tax=Bacillus sp. FJAT-44742 TaxID=2014005 RepID=UPI0018E27F57|nr:hypothetical protein [Bacillus sp. FJAT-44742]
MLPLKAEEFGKYRWLGQGKRLVGRSTGTVIATLLASGYKSWQVTEQPAGPGIARNITN